MTLLPNVQLQKGNPKMTGEKGYYWDTLNPKPLKTSKGASFEVLGFKVSGWGGVPQAIQELNRVGSTPSPEHFKLTGRGQS